MKSYIFLVMMAVLFVLPMVNAADNITMTMVDELTGVPQPWNAQITYISNNATAAYVTAYRAGDNCFYDDDTTTTCIIFSYPISVTGVCANKTTIQAFDQNKANFRAYWRWNNVTTSGSNSGILNIYINSTKIYTRTVTGATTGFMIDNISIDNTNNTYNTKTINFTAEICGNCFGGACENQEGAYLSEFKMVNNTAGYDYIDNTTITMPSTLLTGYSSVVVQARGEVTYNPSYTQTRNYYLTTSQLANYSFKGYLLADAQGYTQPFTILNGNGQGITSALITIGKWYSQIENTLAQCLTGPSGQCSLWLQSNQPLYSTRLTANGYNTYYNQSTPYLSTSGTAIVYMTNSAPVNFQSPFAGISSNIFPTTQYINNVTINSTCQVIATDGNLNFINYTVIIANFTSNHTIYASNYTNSNPSGATLKIPLNDNGQFQLGCTYEWVSNVTGNATTYRQTNSMTLWMYNSNMGSAASAGFNPWFSIIIALGVILIVCAPIAIISPTYGMITGIFLMLMFASVGMIPDVVIMGNVVSGWYLSGLSILTAIALLIIKNFS